MTDYPRAKEQLAEIMNEFSGYEWFYDGLDKIEAGLQWMNEQLANWLGAVLDAEVDLRIGWLLPVLLTIIIGVLLWRIGKNVMFRKTDLETHMDIPTIKEKKQEVWWEEAEDCARQKMYREGIRCLFQGVLESLDQQGFLKRQDSKTNREYLTEVQKSRYESVTSFTDLVIQFERVWYGLSPVEERDYRNFLQLSLQLIKKGGKKAVE
ncbi:DUF4129 domain-containing protein [Kroppenstedtia pulmonis]|uniref:DUF4129 domain-containing protein n=1 Tax=Kroppenstedtia pulmonis TaxID=1380685 RepID=A0A7D4BHD1_9BACL|nr:DUF4129 domain-containing protein [Kroppenstedtia pulmonis]QKG84435.1 DUF4129 domain-containing protein [Kroppenstedtia pulmonis]